MTRDEAWELLGEYTKTTTLRRSLADVSPDAAPQRHGASTVAPACSQGSSVAGIVPARLSAIPPPRWLLSPLGKPAEFRMG